MSVNYVEKQIKSLLWFLGDSYAYQSYRAYSICEILLQDR